MDTFKLKCASLLTRTFAKVDHVTRTHFLAGVIPINPFKISEAFPTVFCLLGSGCFIPHCVLLILLRVSFVHVIVCSKRHEKLHRQKFISKNFCVGFKEFFHRLDKIKAEREASKPFAFREHLLVLIQLNKVFIPTKNKPE